MMRDQSESCRNDTGKKKPENKNLDASFEDPVPNKQEALYSFVINHDRLIYKIKCFLLIY